MARNRIKFNKDIQEIIKDASKKAYTSSFHVKTNDDDNINTLAEKMSSKFAEVFAKEMGPKLAKAIDDQLDSQFFDVSGLGVSGSKVVGIIKSV